MACHSLFYCLLLGIIFPMFNIPKQLFWTIVTLFTVFVLLLILNLPPVYSAVAPRMDTLRGKIVYFFSPPEEAIFSPSTPLASTTSTAALIVTATPTAEVTSATITSPTVTPTPLPTAVILPNVKYVDQHNRWNYCGPANLSMSLNFWGWQGTRDDVAAVVKPGENNLKLDFIQRGKTDKNVMPYEMVDFVNDETDFNALQRVGGTRDLLKTFISNGLPVVIEKGYYERDYNGKISWLGHYLFVTGYDDSQKAFIVQDAYLEPGESILSPYDKFDEGWRAFDYLFMVIYPDDKALLVNDLLGEYLDPEAANNIALERANKEIGDLEGMNLYFAWFNKGTSLVNLNRYADAAPAFDQAFAIYNELDDTEYQRPYRMLWYQTSPYKAYFYSARYTDVISLADTILNDTMDKPTAEESLYWRALAEIATGDSYNGIKDLQSAVYYNPHMTVAIDQLNQLGAPLIP